MEPDSELLLLQDTSPVLSGPGSETDPGMDVSKMDQAKAPRKLKGETNLVALNCGYRGVPRDCIALGARLCSPGM